MTGLGWLAVATVLAAGVPFALLRALPAPAKTGGAGQDLADVGAAGRPARSLSILAGLLVGGAVGVALLDPTRLALAIVVGVAVEGARRLGRRGRQRKEAARTRAEVVEVGEALVAELRAGRPVQAALERAARQWHPLAPTAGAAELGADVPASLRRLARRPGAEGLADIAVAWELAGRTGAGLAAALDRVVAGARAAQADQAAVAGELASARATARVVAGLPVVTLALGAGAGVDTWQWLLDSPGGLACLAASTTLALLGLVWIDRIADSVAQP